MKRVIIIDGGAGRVIAAIPALIKHINQNKNDDIKILVYGWSFLLYGIKQLSNKVFQADVIGAFENYFKECDEVIKPEPYIRPSYFKQQKSLVEVFDECLNNTEDHSDLCNPFLIIDQYEKENAQMTLQEMAQRSGKSKVVIIQPFGRSSQQGMNKIYDNSNRSIPQDLYLRIVKELSKEFAVLFMGEESQFVQQDKYTAKFGADLRAWLALISECSYFIGCDSFGQHAARSFNKNGSVFIGSTFTNNITYPDFFHIVERNNVNKIYSPIRLADQDTTLADKHNQHCFDYTEQEFKLIINEIKENIRGSKIEYISNQHGSQCVSGSC